MPECKCVTMEVPLNGLPFAMLSVINEHIEHYNLGPILPGALWFRTTPKRLSPEWSPISGLQVSGLFTDASEPASAFIGLDNDSAAQKFTEIAIKAAQDAKK